LNIMVGYTVSRRANRNVGIKDFRQALYYICSKVYVKRFIRNMDSPYGLIANIY